jgi:hypothetical protein
MGWKHVVDFQKLILPQIPELQMNQILYYLVDCFMFKWANFKDLKYSLLVTTWVSPFLAAS